MQGTLHKLASFALILQIAICLDSNLNFAISSSHMSIFTKQNYPPTTQAASKLGNLGKQLQDDKNSKCKCSIFNNNVKDIGTYTIPDSIASGKEFSELDANTEEKDCEPMHKRLLQYKTHVGGDKNIQGKLNADADNSALPSLSTYDKAFLSAIDFNKYYARKGPSAMTIDCKLLNALKVTRTPNNKKITIRSTNILVIKPTTTFTTQLELIEVSDVTKKQKRGYNNSWSSLHDLSTSTTPALFSPSTSDAASPPKNRLKLKIFAAFSFILVIFPWITVDDKPDDSFPKVPSKKRVRSITSIESHKKRIKCSYIK